MPVDPNIPLSAGVNLPQFGPNLNQLAQLQQVSIQIQKAQQVQQAQNALKSFFSNTDNYDPNTLAPKGNALADLARVSPEGAMLVQKNALANQASQTRNAFVNSEIVGKLQTDLKAANSEALNVYNDWAAKGAPPDQAKQRAQEVMDEKVGTLKSSGLFPTSALAGMNTQFDPIRAGAVAMTPEQKIENARAERTEKRLENSGYTLQKQKGPDGQVSEIWVKPGAPSLDLAGNPVTPTGMPAPTGAEAKPEFVGNVKGEGGKIDSEVPLLYQNGSWIDSRTNKPVSQDQLSGIRRMGTESSNPRAQAVSQFLRENPNATAEQIAEFQRTLTTPRSAPAMFMQKFMQEHPNADSDALAMAAARYRQAGAMEQAFASGAQGNTIRSLNVAIDHTDVLKQLGDALQNNDIQKLNSLKNRVMVEFGHEGPVNFDVAKKIVADEVIKAVLGNNVGTGQERLDMQKDFDNANSPKQLNGVIETARRLMLGQMRGLEFQYAGQDEKRREDFRGKLFDHTKEALEVTDKSGARQSKSQEGTVVPIAPSGGQQAAPASQGEIKQVTTPEEAAGLPAGAHYRRPDDPPGSFRVRQ